MNVNSERTLRLASQLIEEAKGEVIAAAIISGKMTPASDVGQALNFAKQHAASLSFDSDSYRGIGRFHMKSLIEHITEASQKLDATRERWGSIVAVRRTKGDTSALFENNLDRAQELLADNYYGATRVIREIISDDNARPEASETVLNLLADSLIALHKATKHISDLRHPRWYRISPRGFILIAVAVLIISTGLFLVLEHSGSVREVATSSSAVVSQINHDVVNSDKSIPARAVSVGKSVWDFVPSAAKVLTAIPILLAFIRKVYTWDKGRDRTLRRWHSAFKELGASVKRM
jgi:hypothetical protein